MITMHSNPTLHNIMHPTLSRKADPLHELFIQNVSHELRTPLAHVLGYAELLDNDVFGILAPEQKEAMMVILQRAHDLQSIVEKVGILLASVTNARDYGPVSLSQLVITAAARKEAHAQQSGIAFCCTIQPELPSIQGDQNHLAHMIDCLLDNALKFTPLGQTVSTELYGDATWLYLRVVDSGIGMTVEETEAIVINQFYQADATATRRYGGLGLGLTLVKAVVQAHGGELDIMSTPGQGSQFTVKLPVVMPDMTTVPGPVHQRRHRVLVVDDEPTVALIIQQALKRLPDCDIVTASNGHDAWQLFQKESFDLLITDYNMPDMDGMTLARHVRHQSPRTVVIMITAYSSPQLTDATTDTIIQQVLNKPIGISEIRHLVLEALKHVESE